jgi:hypothetical protein
MNLDLSGSEYGPVTGSCEYDGEILGSIKSGKFLHNKQLLASQDDFSVQSIN